MPGATTRMRPTEVSRLNRLLAARSFLSACRPFSVRFLRWDRSVCFKNPPPPNSPAPLSNPASPASSLNRELRQRTEQRAHAPPLPRQRRRIAQTHPPTIRRQRQSTTPPIPQPQPPDHRPTSLPLHHPLRSTRRCASHRIGDCRNRCGLADGYRKAPSSALRAPSPASGRREKYVSTEIRRQLGVIAYGVSTGTPHSTTGHCAQAPAHQRATEDSERDQGQGVCTERDSEG